MVVCSLGCGLRPVCETRWNKDQGACSDACATHYAVALHDGASAMCSMLSNLLPNPVALLFRAPWRSPAWRWVWRPPPRPPGCGWRLSAPWVTPSRSTTTSSSGGSTRRGRRSRWERNRDTGRSAGCSAEGGDWRGQRGLAKRRRQCHTPYYCDALHRIVLLAFSVQPAEPA